MTWFVVHVGRRPGVYSNWDDAHAQVNVYRGACQKNTPTGKKHSKPFMVVTTMKSNQLNVNLM
jgi:viroplasmin and RNaseH domain-containing protein